MYNHTCADSPVIVFSPHQHQFNPISCAAHSLNLPQSKPVMDRRPYDIPLSNATAAKRSHAEVDTKEKGVGFNAHATPTPMHSPEEGSGLISRGSAISLHHPDSPLVHHPEPDPNSNGTNGTTPSPTDSPESSDAHHKRKVSRHESVADVGDDAVAATPQASASRDNLDPFTVALGVGWRTPDQSVAAISARRGHATFIQNIHNLSNVSIAAVNVSNARVLVEAGDGWFLFDESLQTGRLLARDKDQALNNLRQDPTVFEGAVIGQGEDIQVDLGHSGVNGELRDAEPVRGSDDTERGMVVGEMEMD